MAKVQVNDIEMYYEIHGQGQPLIFIAGFGADHNTWLPVLNDFAKSYQVIIFDNRGAGQTTVPNFPYNIDMFVDDITELCTKLNIPSAHFVGNSMGGMILQRLLSRHPELVKSAVVSNSSMSSNKRFMLYIEAKLDLIKTEAPARALIQEGLPWVFSEKFLANPETTNNLIELALQYPYRFSAIGYEQQMHALKQFDSHAWLHEVKNPCLVIGSDQDAIFSQVEQFEMVEVIENAASYCFEAVGHLPHIENPKLYAEVVMKFLEKHS